LVACMTQVRWGSSSWEKKPDPFPIRDPSLWLSKFFNPMFQNLDMNLSHKHLSSSSNYQVTQDLEVYSCPLLKKLLRRRALHLLMSLKEPTHNVMKNQKVEANTKLTISFLPTGRGGQYSNTYFFLAYQRRRYLYVGYQGWDLRPKHCPQWLWNLSIFSTLPLVLDHCPIFWPLLLGKIGQTPISALSIGWMLWLSCGWVVNDLVSPWWPILKNKVPICR
jgi:hypothetical protein